MNKRRILSAKNIHKTFSDPSPLHILKGISLDIHEGESIAIMGKSGEGKSTLLHILGSLEAPSEGEIEICGQLLNAKKAPELRNRHVGFVFQSSHLLEDYSVLENILMPMQIGRKPIDQKRGLELLEQVGLSSRANFRSKLLSGGEKQRVAIARALCNDPDLLLADEPSGNLDHSNSENIHQLLLTSVKQWNKSLIVVTHDRDLAALCDRILILKDGKFL